MIYMYIHVWISVQNDIQAPIVSWHIGNGEEAQGMAEAF